MGRNVLLFALLNFGIAWQLSPKRHALLIFLNVFYDRLGFSGSRVASALVISVSWVGTEIFFRVFVVGAAGIGREGESWAGCSIVEEFQNS